MKSFKAVCKNLHTPICPVQPKGAAKVAMPSGCIPFGKSMPMRNKVLDCYNGIITGSLCDGVPKPKDGDNIAAENYLNGGNSGTLNNISQKGEHKSSSSNVASVDNTTDTNPDTTPPPRMDPAGVHGSSDSPPPGMNPAGAHGGSSDLSSRLNSSPDS